MINSRLPFLFHSMVACGDSSRYVLLRPGSHQLYRLLPHLDDHRRWTSCRHCLLVVRDLESLCPYFSTLASLALGCSYLHHFLRACLCAWPARNHARVTYSSLPLLPFCYLHFSQPAPASPQFRSLRTPGSLVNSRQIWFPFVAGAHSVSQWEGDLVPGSYHEHGRFHWALE